MMTENKRFAILIDSNDRKSLWDDERTEEEPLIALNRFGEIWGIDNVCDLLNEQDTTIKELGKENEQLKSICQDHKDHAIDFKADCIRLEKENEQFQSEVSKLTDLLASEIEKNAKLLQAINSLKIENMRLKEEIKDFQDILARKEEELLKPVIRMIDDKINEIKPYNSELCRLTLMELRKELKGR